MSEQETEVLPDLPRRRDLHSFGERLRQLRDRAGLTQSELADASGFDRVAISQIERGQREVGVTRIKPMATALGVSPKDLFEWPESLPA